MKRAPVVLGFGPVEVPSVGSTEPVQREDGDVRPAAKRGKTERYPRAWVQQEAAAQRRVQLNPFYQFLELVAGITGSTVHQYYDEEDSRQRANRQAEMAFRRQVVRETYTAEHAARLQIMQRLFGTSQMELFMDGQTAKVRFRESGLAGAGGGGGGEAELPPAIADLRRHFRDKESMDFNKYLESVKAAMNMDVGSQLDMLEEMYMGHSRSWAEMPEHSGQITVNAQVAAAIDTSFALLKTRAELTATCAEELIYAGVDTARVVDKLKAENPLIEELSQRHFMARIQMTRYNRIWSIRLWSQMAMRIVYALYDTGAASQAAVPAQQGGGAAPEQSAALTGSLEPASTYKSLEKFWGLTSEITRFDSQEMPCLKFKGAQDGTASEYVGLLEKATAEIEDTFSASFERLKSITLPSGLDMGTTTANELQEVVDLLPNSVSDGATYSRNRAKCSEWGLWIPKQSARVLAYGRTQAGAEEMLKGLSKDLRDYANRQVKSMTQEGVLYLGKDVYEACKKAGARYRNTENGKMVRSYFARMVAVHLMMSQVMSGKRYVPQKRVDELMTQRNNLGVWFRQQEPQMRGR